MFSWFRRKSPFVRDVESDHRDYLINLLVARCKELERQIEAMTAQQEQE